MGDDEEILYRQVPGVSDPVAKKKRKRVASKEVQRQQSGSKRGRGRPHARGVARREVGVMQGSGEKQLAILPKRHRLPPVVKEVQPKRKVRRTQAPTRATRPRRKQLQPVQREEAQPPPSKSPAQHKQALPLPSKSPAKSGAGSSKKKKRFSFPSFARKD